MKLKRRFPSGKIPAGFETDHPVRKLSFQEWDALNVFLHYVPFIRSGEMTQEALEAMFTPAQRRHLKSANDKLELYPEWWNGSRDRAKAHHTGTE